MSRSGGVSEVLGFVRSYAHEVISLLLLPALVIGDELFVEVTSDALLAHPTTCGSLDKDWIIEVNGGGLVVEDFNADGHLDLVVVDGSTVERARAGEAGEPPRLYLGDGACGFSLAGEAWQMSGGRWGMGGAAGDLNNDGYPDLVVTQWGPDRVFLNEGGAGLREVTEEAGLVGGRWGASAALLDYDADGNLDLAVVNYLAFDPDEVKRRGEGCAWKGHDVMCGPEGLIPVHDQLYRGLGDGRFEDVTLAAGFAPLTAGYGLGVITLDVDGDGRTDLYTANDSTPNHLWRNKGDGTFEEIAWRHGVGHDANGKEQAGMGIACADANEDGVPDLFVTNFSGENNALYLSRKGRFRERSYAVGLGGASLRRLGWGTSYGDFDLDGHLDLFVLNGHVYPQADQPGTDTSYAQPDQVFLQGANGRFTEVALGGVERVSRAGVSADLDADGDLDLIALELGGPARVWQNTSASSGAEARWLGVRLAGTAAHGASLELAYDADGERVTLKRFARTAGGFQASCPLACHFVAERWSGEGAVTLRVRWLGGGLSEVELDSLGRWVELSAPAGEPK